MVLDMLAVLLGGAVALLPVYAMAILHTGSFGLGVLRAAPGLGAIVTGLWLARRPAHRNAGHVLLVSTAIFGLKLWLDPCHPHHRGHRGYGEHPYPKCPDSASHLARVARQSSLI